MNEPWIIRPHHGLCLKHFTGNGYSDGFIQRMTEVSVELQTNPFREIVLYSETDILCKACPHNVNGICETAQKVARYDQKCLELCGLHNGEIMQWQQFEQLIVQKILKPHRLSEICSDCCWSNICQNHIMKQSKIES